MLWLKSIHSPAIIYSIISFIPALINHKRYDKILEANAAVKTMLGMKNKCYEKLKSVL